MADLKKYIAIVLFGIFVFPIVFQPVHVVLHHAQDLHDCHTCCHSTFDKDESANSDEIVPASAQEEACPICDYHFPLNLIAKAFIYQSNKMVDEKIVIGLNIRLPFLQLLSVKTPRAPPALT
ncbi:hypothetical protein [Carboxylicivirga sp. N1Y90]|uniref:hypothetical protein n=1 Tax=Carboxylicivirga fragile TaxID=3417571 RepID=UPI003D325800|nr:hypothetical protein [Marinilabiliaceae bacterium N1Y90]